jgi:hypothetical protein
MITRRSRLPFNLGCPYIAGILNRDRSAAVIRNGHHIISGTRRLFWYYWAPIAVLQEDKSYAHAVAGSM